MIKSLDGKHCTHDIFWKVDVTFGGVKFPSVGHAFESAKSIDEAWVRTCANPNSTKELLERWHDTLEMVPNWNNIKLMTMFDLLKQKYNQEPYRQQLLDTRGQNITAGGSGADTFWGVDWDTSPNEGENWLGRMLMKIRTELRDSLK